MDWVDHVFRSGWPEPADAGKPFWPHHADVVATLLGLKMRLDAACLPPVNDGEIGAAPIYRMTDWDTDLGRAVPRWKHTFRPCPGPDGTCSGSTPPSDAQLAGPEAAAQTDQAAEGAWGEAPPDLLSPMEPWELAEGIAGRQAAASQEEGGAGAGSRSTSHLAQARYTAAGSGPLEDCEVGVAISPIMSADYYQKHQPVNIGLVGIDEFCYRCSKPHRAIAGVVVAKADVRTYLGLGDDLFLDFDTVAEALRDALDPAWMKEWEVGPLKVRRSRERPEGYLSNGCVWCDAILGSFPLSEAVREIEPERLPEHVFAHVSLPLDVLLQPASPWLDHGGCGPNCDCGA